MSKLPKKNLMKEIAEELDVLGTMLSALVELLEKKGILTHEEWEKRIKSKIARAKGIPKYRDVQFSDE